MAQKAEATTGSKETSGCPDSLFPGERPRRKPRPSITKKLDDLIGDRVKAVAVALRPKKSVKTAEASLRHSLSGENGKKVGLDELDTVLDELGPEIEAVFMRFFCERRMWKAPERMTSREWALMKLEEIERRDRERALEDAEKRVLLEQVRDALKEDV